MSEAWWLCAKDKVVHGPYTEEQVRGFIQEGRATRATWYRQGDDEWRQGRDIPALFPQAASGAPNRRAARQKPPARTDDATRQVPTRFVVAGLIVAGLLVAGAWWLQRDRGARHTGFPVTSPDPDWVDILVPGSPRDETEALSRRFEELIAQAKERQEARRRIHAGIAPLDLARFAKLRVPAEFQRIDVEDQVQVAKLNRWLRDALPERIAYLATMPVFGGGLEKKSAATVSIDMGEDGGFSGYVTVLLPDRVTLANATIALPPSMQAQRVYFAGAEERRARAIQALRDGQLVRVKVVMRARFGRPRLERHPLGGLVLDGYELDVELQAP